MKKLVLAFPSKERMAEFILACKIVAAEMDGAALTLTGYFSKECLDIAFNQYEAVIAAPPDFILPAAK